MTIRERIEMPKGSIRLVLRSMSLAPDKFPERVRASTIASYWWCGWKSYATAMLGLKMPEKEWMVLGTSLHDKLFATLGKRFPWENKFVEEIDKYRKDDLGFVRRFGMDTEIFVDLTGHPDDFQVTPGNEVSVIEYKTTRMPLYLAKRFITCVAAFQALIYPWVIEPTVKALGYTLSRYHAVMIHDSKDMSLMHHKIVAYDSVYAEKQISEIFSFYRNPETIQPCAAWKCKYCSDIFKRECPFAAKEVKA